MWVSIELDDPEARLNCTLLLYRAENWSEFLALAENWSEFLARAENWDEVSARAENWCVTGTILL